MKLALPCTFALLLASGLLSVQARALPHSVTVQSNQDSQAAKPAHTYRVVFTLTEQENGKRVGAQHFAITAIPGRTAILKQGSRVPFQTGSSTPQFTYVDIGLNCSVTLTEQAEGVEAQVKVEQSSVAEAPGEAIHEPIIRQSVLENSAVLRYGKPVVMGALDTPGSTRHIEVEVALEPIP